MGEQSTDTGASTQDGNTQTTDPTSGGGDKPKVITMTSEQLAERLARAKPADYDDLKTKAAKLDEIEAANKSEIEKANDKASTAEQRAATAEAEALRLRVAVKHGISIEDADLFLTGTDEETLTKQAERLTERVTDRKKNGNVVPKEGTTPRDPATDPMREFTRKLFDPAGA